MATLIPTTGTASFDSGGKRRLAQRLVQRLSDDSLSGTVRVRPKQAAAPRAQTQRRLPPRRRRHSGDDHEGKQRLGIPRGGAIRRGAHACARRGREGSGAGVLCGGYSDYAEVGYDSQREQQLSIPLTACIYPQKSTL